MPDINTAIRIRVWNQIEKLPEEEQGLAKSLYTIRNRLQELAQLRFLVSMTIFVIWIAIAFGNFSKLPHMNWQESALRTGLAVAGWWICRKCAIRTLFAPRINKHEEEYLKIYLEPGGYNAGEKLKHIIDEAHYISF